MRLLYIIAALAFLLVPGPVMAQLPGCDANTRNVIINQAVLESRRELIMNQTYINKPDSVFEYACWQDTIDKTAQIVGPFFSESSAWQNGSMGSNSFSVSLGDSSLDGALASVVTSALTPYIQTNFIHGYLGGTSEGAAVADSPCSVMGQVWKAAKCFNFEYGPKDPSKKLFYSFEELVFEDPRKFPQECGHTGITLAMVQTARNQDHAFAKYDRPLDLGGIFLSNSGDSCSMAIPTGLTVKRKVAAKQISENVSYFDAICTNAGCSYQTGLTDSGKVSGQTGECKVRKQ